VKIIITVTFNLIAKMITSNQAKNGFNPVILLFCFLLLFSTILAENLKKADFTGVKSDKYRKQTEADLEENRFQNEINSLFDSNYDDIDTTGWLINKINGWRFDYSALNDTLRIPFIDSLHKRYFTFPFKNYTTSPFGSRRGFWHFGQDIKLRVGDTVKNALDGIVRIIVNDRYGYGKVVVVRHHYGLETLYAHLSKTSVKQNDKLKSGDIIGLGGRSGKATGSHLHFEIRLYGQPFDPNLIIDFENYTARSDTLFLCKDNFSYLTDLRKTVVHTIRKGETLSAIAKRNGTTVQSLCKLNGIKSSTILRIGRRLIVRKGSNQFHNTYVDIFSNSGT